MSNFTTDVYETKREIMIFSNKLTNGLSKPNAKFVKNMIYGIAKKQSCHLTDIARSLDEKTKLINIVDRLSSQISAFSDDNLKILENNFYSIIKNCIPDEPVINLDNSEIVKRYAKSLENLDAVVDASSLKKADVQPGYHVCEASLVTKNEKQPLSIYSHIYSTKAAGFKSMNDETLKCISAIKGFIDDRCTFVMDRGYDADIFFNYFLKTIKNKDNFIIRLKGNRNILFKGKSKKVEEIAKTRKGKIRMSMYFKEKEKEAYVSHTRVELPKYKGIPLTLILVYGLSEEKPMMLLTNKKIKEKEDVHKVVRQYMQRWRIEEGFRFKKQGYGFEKMLVRKIHNMNVINSLLMMHIGHLTLLTESINKKLLVIKIVERSRSLKSKSYFWLYQIKEGISEILKFSQRGIEDYLHIRKQEPFKQLRLNI